MYIYVPVVFCFYNEHEHSFVPLQITCPLERKVY